LTPTAESGEVLVVVDQFEEVFTLCRDPDQREGFLRLLLAARNEESRLRVLCAVRADFYRHCAEHPDLAGALRDAHLLVPPMTRTELRDAIVRPATTTGLIIERDLTQRLVDTVADRPGALPLLSHTLLETWHRRSGRTLTLHAYEETGGLDQAIATTAEHLYTHLTPTQQDHTRHLLLRLITPGDTNAPDTRRPLTPTELTALHTTPDTRTVIETLTHARLVTLDDNTLELTHETLLTAWPRLRGWTDEARERLHIHRALTHAATTWHTLDRDPGALYRGTRLTQAEEHLTPHHLTPLEHTFLTTSTTTRDHEHHTTRRTTQRLRRLRTVLTLIAAIALLAATIAWQENHARDRQNLHDEARRIATLATTLRQSDPTTAMRLALAAHHTADLPETRAALTTAAT
ncbi:nSTAND1 domain-containing NTPase, partial [Streptomyces yaizuensis]